MIALLIFLFSRSAVKVVCAQIIYRVLDILDVFFNLHDRFAQRIRPGLQALELGGEELTPKYLTEDRLNILLIELPFGSLGNGDQLAPGVQLFQMD